MSQTSRPDRVCDAPGCQTKLSIYNLSPRCWQHADLQFPNYRGKRLIQPNGHTAKGSSQYIA